MNTLAMKYIPDGQCDPKKQGIVIYKGIFPLVLLIIKFIFCFS
jgi:hypothetical protein